MNPSLLAALTILSASTALAGQPQPGTLTAIEGTVELLRAPSRNLPPGGASQPRALFEGRYYEYREARVGDRVGNGEFVRVRPGGKAQILFDNGDAIRLGPGSLFRPSWSQDSADPQKARPRADLRYGGLHALISKSGPRSKLRIQSRAMVLGVRGTEFSLQSDASGQDRLSVLRGEVELKPAAPPSSGAPPPGPVAVKENQTARIETAHRPVEVARTTQEEISEIQKLAKPPRTPEAAPKSDAVRALEKKADSLALQDLKAYHPEIAREILADLTAGHGGAAPSAAELQDRLMERRKREAPSGGGAYDAVRKAYENQLKPE